MNGSFSAHSGDQVKITVSNNNLNTYRFQIQGVNTGVGGDGTSVYVQYTVK